MKRWAGLPAFVAAGAFALAGCSQSVQAEPAAATTSAGLAWSSSAVAACRAFDNALPNEGAARALVKNAKKNPTLKELRQAEKDWADATAGMSTNAADLAVAAEEPVYDALSGVRKALAMRPGDNVYVSYHVKFFGDAFAICDDVLA